MRIALVAPLHEHIPPVKYGGVERIVSFLAEELVRLGHEVTLYACGDSVTTAHLIKSWPRSFRDDGIGFNNEQVKGPYGKQLQRVYDDHRARPYDLIHIHHGTEPFHLDAMVKGMSGPTLWTDHGLLDYGSKPEIFRYLQLNFGVRITAISLWQQSTLSPQVLCDGVIHNGVPVDLLSPLGGYGDQRSYLAFLGRVAPEKGIEDAIEIARRSGFRLRIAAKIDPVFQEYYEQHVERLLETQAVQFVGEIDDDAKSAFLGGAVALLFPVRWDEPFGLVMVEAFACGTPVIAYRRGAVDEVVEEGVTGFKVRGVDEAVEAVFKIPSLERRKIREVFERDFTAHKMTASYLEVYERIMREWQLDHPIPQ